MTLSAQLGTALAEDKVNDQADELRRALIAAHKDGGYDGMMMLAYRVEAGIEFKKIDQPRKMLADVLRDVGKQLKLAGNDIAKLSMYRDDLRHGR